MVDPERALFREGGEHRIVNYAGRGKVMAQRFFKRDPSLFPRQSGGLQPGDGHRKQRRRCGQKDRDILHPAVPEHF